MLSLRASIALAAFALASCGDDTNVADPADADSLGEAAEALPNPQAGEYRSTGELVEFSVPGMGEEETAALRGVMEAGFTQPNTFCITPEESAQGYQRFVQEMQQGSGECELTGFETSDSTLNATMSCSGEQGAEGTVTFAGQVTETEQDMTVTMDMKSEQMPGGGMRMVVRTNSERIGECPA